jgi:hypothetical protein
LRVAKTPEAFAVGRGLDAVAMKLALASALARLENGIAKAGAWAVPSELTLNAARAAGMGF